MKVFVFDPLWAGLLTDENQQALDAAGAEVILTTNIAPLGKCAALFEGDEERLLVVNPDYVNWDLPAEIFKDIPNLKGVILSVTSYGWVDVAFAASENIPVANISNYSTDAVAEMALMMMLNITRKIPLMMKAGFPLNFGSDFSTYQGVNLKGKKAGVIGLGNIGSAIAERCKGLGMEVVYWSASSRHEDYTYMELEALFKACDVVFPTMADNEGSKNIITDGMLGKLKPEGMMVSIVPKYYNHDLMLKRVASGDLYGYAFEAGAGEFNQFEGNVWAAPAYAWCTDGSLRRAMDFLVDGIVDGVSGSWPSRVN